MDQTVFWMSLVLKVLFFPTIMCTLYFTTKNALSRTAFFLVTCIFLILMNLTFRLTGERFKLCLDSAKNDEIFKTEIAKLELQHTEYLRVAALQGIKTDLTRGYLIWRPEE